MTRILKYYAESDVGCVRKNNEDMAYVAGQIVRDNKCEGELRHSDGCVAFAVADGMGGYEGGEVASEIVTRSFGAFVNKISDGTSDSVITQLKDWASNANKLVLDTASLRPELSEMGTTFVGLLFIDDKLWLINVGDSRCYRIRNGVLKQLSTDHSERARTGNPDVPSNLIYNFIGLTPKEFISDITELSAIPGDIYLLCSDGLSDLVSDDDIESLSTTPDNLVEKAKLEGGRDNITIVTVRYENED